MLQKLISDLVSKRAELKLKKKELSDLLKKDEGYKAIIDDLKADREVMKSYREKLITASPDLQFKQTSIYAAQSELRALNKALQAKIVPAVVADNGRLSFSGI